MYYHEMQWDSKTIQSTFVDKVGTDIRDSDYTAGWKTSLHHYISAGDTVTDWRDSDSQGMFYVTDQQLKDLVVTCGNTTLVEGTDYEISEKVGESNKYSSFTIKFLKNVDGSSYSNPVVITYRTNVEGIQSAEIGTAMAYKNDVELNLNTSGLTSSTYGTNTYNKVLMINKEVAGTADNKYSEAYSISDEDGDGVNEVYLDWYITVNEAGVMSGDAVVTDDLPDSLSFVSAEIDQSLSGTDGKNATLTLQEDTATTKAVKFNLSGLVANTKDTDGDKGKVVIKVRTRVIDPDILMANGTVSITNNSELDYKGMHQEDDANVEYTFNSIAKTHVYGGATASHELTFAGVINSLDVDLIEGNDKESNKYITVVDEIKTDTITLKPETIKIYDTNENLIYDNGSTENNTDIVKEFKITDTGFQFKIRDDHEYLLVYTCYISGDPDTTTSFENVLRYYGKDTGADDKDSQKIYKSGSEGEGLPLFYIIKDDITSSAKRLNGVKFEFGTVSVVNGEITVTDTETLTTKNDTIGNDTQDGIIFKSGLNKTSIYAFRETASVEGYYVSDADKEWTYFTFGGQSVVHAAGLPEGTKVELYSNGQQVYRHNTPTSIEVTKQFTDGVNDGTYYFGLFNNAEQASTNTIDSVTFENGEQVTDNAKFTGLKAGTYYVYELEGSNGVKVSGKATVNGIKYTISGDGAVTIDANNPAKSITITNDEIKEGSLVIQKQVIGGETTGTFEFVVKGADGKYYNANGASTTEVINVLNYTSTNTSITLTNIPVQKYTVTEKNASGYTPVNVKAYDGVEVEVTADNTTTQPIVNQYAASGTAVIEGTKNLTGKEWGNETFTFNLKSGDTTIDTQTATKEKQDFTFSTITYKLNAAQDTVTAYVTKDGKEESIGTANVSSDKATFIYTVTEDATNKIDGIEYDDTVYTVTVTLTHDHAGNLTAAYNYGEGKTTAEFTNTYIAEGKITLQATKNLVGKAWGSDEYEFVLYDANNKQLDSQKATSSKQTVDFSQISFELVNNQSQIVAKMGNETIGTADVSNNQATFNFTIKETKGSYAGVTYDTSTSNVVVTVKHETGKLTATAKYDNADSKKFTNTYSAKGTAKVTGSKTLTGKTWSDEEFTFYLKSGDTTIDTKTANKDASSFEFGEIAYTLSADQKTITATYGDSYTETQDVTDNKATFTYTVSEKDGGETKDGIVYDSTVYTVTVTMTHDNAGNLTATYNYGKEGVSTAAFTNEYKAQGTATINGNKVLTGRDWTDNDVFTFDLKSGTDVVESKTATKTSQNFTFSTITYKLSEDQKTIAAYKADGSQIGDAVEVKDNKATFTYTVSEEAGQISGVAYDNTVYTATVVVTHNTGSLSTKVTYAKGEQAANAVTFTNDYTANGEAVIGGTKTLTGRTIKDEEFSFDLKAGETTIQTVKNKGEAFTFDKIEYSLAETEDGRIVTAKAGTYTESKTLGTNGAVFTYTVVEQAGTDESVTYDTTARTVTVTVTDKGDGNLNVVKSYGEGVTGISIVNKYGASGSIEINGTKTLTGRELKANEFTFKLLDSNKNDITSTTNTADGSFKFGSISYALNDAGDSVVATYGNTYSETIALTEHAATFTYYVTEVKGTLGGVTYDENDKTVTVTVTDDGSGKLTVEKDSAQNPVTFTNTYAASGKKNFTAKKLLNNITPDLTFTFTLSDANGVQQTVTNNGETVTFSDITYTLSKDGKTITDSYGNVQKVNDDMAQFTYTIKETANAVEGADLDGIVFDETEYTATMTVSDANKDGKLVVLPTYSKGETTATSATFNNYRLGDLKVSKVVDGDKADTSKKFTFTIAITDETGKAYVDQYKFTTVDQDGKETEDAIEFTDGVTTVELADGESITIKDLPYGASYKVTETNYNEDGYVTSMENAEGTIGSGTEVAVSATNTMTYFTVTKTDIVSKEEVEGAEFAILDADGNVVTVKYVEDGEEVEEELQWTSTDEAKEIYGLAPGTYTLSEVQAPKNYLPIEDVEFTLDTDGKITVNTEEFAEGNAYAEDNEIVVEDMQYDVVDISKTWDDDNDANSYRPDYVTMYLVVDGEKTEESINLYSTDNWQGSIENLPKYRYDEETESYVEIVYTVEEDLTQLLYNRKAQSYVYVKANGDLTFDPVTITDDGEEVENRQATLADAYEANYPEEGPHKKTGNENYGYDVQVSNSFTVVSPPPLVQEGLVKVTKQVVDSKGQKLSVPAGYTFYVALFTDEDLTDRYSEIKALTFEGTSSTTVEFSSLKCFDDDGNQIAYYLAEVDENGNPINSTDGAEMVVAGDDGTAKTYTNKPDYDMKEVVAEEASDGKEITTHEITNTFEEVPFPYSAELEITKTVVDYSGKASASSATFYAGIFKDGKLIDDGIVELKMNGKASQTVTHKVDLGYSDEEVQYTIEEVDKNGNKVSTITSFGYTVTYTYDSKTRSNPYTVTLKPDAKEAITIKNRKPKTPDTGVQTNSTYYASTLALAGCGAALILLKKKKEDEE